MFADGVLQLPEKRHGLHEAGGPHGMAAGEKSAGRVYGKFAVERRVSFVDEAATVAVFAQAEVFVGLKFAGSVGIVQLDHIQIFEWMLDARHFVSSDGGAASSAERMDPRVMQPDVIGFFLVRQQRHFAMRPIRKAHAITPGANAADANWIVAKLLCRRFRCQEANGSAIAHDANIMSLERPGN